ncbi:hypothetical protein L1987_36180 [Smallanthus sonchifolius]|uniref:Uncharacterized protein n=1 Tax=Smallanthus sonchifolius TaxID=185202 RepID=A0ACB9HE06_9ASTR|nr:hypothetical protein L1987_36180 [Smallanthus sonchifolius]
MMAHGDHLFSKVSVSVALAFTAVLFFTAAVNGVTHTVGDSIWSIPPTIDFYDKWSSSRTFYTGDFLYFDFESEMYNVIRVTFPQEANCSSAVIRSYGFYRDGPALVPLNEAGDLNDIILD